MSVMPTIKGFTVVKAPGWIIECKKCQQGTFVFGPNAAMDAVEWTAQHNRSKHPAKPPMKGRTSANKS